MCGYLPCLNNLRHSNGVRTSECGAVLIMVLLIVALVAGLGIKFASEYQLGMARAESRWHGMQARAFLEGTEELAKIVFPTADIDPTSDYIGEPWSNEVPIEEDGVTGVAKLVDATSKFNLNDLAPKKSFDPALPDTDPKRYSERQRFFIRLVQAFPEAQLSTNEAIYLLEAVTDWIDSDDIESGQGGAESNYYQSQPQPYMAANRLFQSVEELRLVRGFTERPELVLSLLPYISVLPGNDVLININTLVAGGAEAEGEQGQRFNPLLLALNAEDELGVISEVDAQAFISKRPETGFSDDKDYVDAWNAQFSKPLDAGIFKLRSDYFWLEATVQLVDQRRSMRSLMKVVEIDGIRNLTVIQRDDVFELPSQVRKKEGDEDENDQ